MYITLPRRFGATLHRIGVATSVKAPSAKDDTSQRVRERVTRNKYVRVRGENNVVVVTLEEMNQ